MTIYEHGTMAPRTMPAGSVSGVMAKTVKLTAETGAGLAIDAFNAAAFAGSAVVEAATLVASVPFNHTSKSDPRYN